MPQSTSHTWVWLGLHDKNTEDTFEWIDGTPVNYTYWQPNQPNDWGPGQDCSGFDAEHEYEWSDERCNANFVEALICKLPKW